MNVLREDEVRGDLSEKKKQEECDAKRTEAGLQLRNAGGHSSTNNLALPQPDKDSISRKYSTESVDTVRTMSTASQGASSLSFRTDTLNSSNASLLSQTDFLDYAQRSSFSSGSSMWNNSIDSFDRPTTFGTSSHEQYPVDQHQISRRTASDLAQQHRYTEPTDDHLHPNTSETYGQVSLPPFRTSSNSDYGLRGQGNFSSSEQNFHPHPQPHAPVQTHQGHLKTHHQSHQNQNDSHSASNKLPVSGSGETRLRLIGTTIHGTPEYLPSLRSDSAPAAQFFGTNPTASSAVPEQGYAQTARYAGDPNFGASLYHSTSSRHVESPSSSFISHEGSSRSQNYSTSNSTGRFTTTSFETPTIPGSPSDVLSPQSSTSSLGSNSRIPTLSVTASPQITQTKRDHAAHKPYNQAANAKAAASNSIGTPQPSTVTQPTQSHQPLQKNDSDSLTSPRHRARATFATGISPPCSETNSPAASPPTSHFVSPQPKFNAQGSNPLKDLTHASERDATSTGGHTSSSSSNTSSKSELQTPKSESQGPKSELQTPKIDHQNQKIDVQMPTKTEQARVNSRQTSSSNFSQQPSSNASVGAQSSFSSSNTSKSMPRARKHLCGAWFPVRNIPSFKFSHFPNSDMSKMKDWEGWEAPPDLIGITRSNGQHAFSLMDPTVLENAAFLAKPEIWGPSLEELGYYFDRVWHRAVDMSRTADTIMGFYEADPRASTHPESLRKANKSRARDVRDIEIGSPDLHFQPNHVPFESEEMQTKEFLNSGFENETEDMWEQEIDDDIASEEGSTGSSASDDSVGEVHREFSEEISDEQFVNAVQSKGRPRAYRNPRLSQRTGRRNYKFEPPYGNEVTLDENGREVYSDRNLRHLPTTVFPFPSLIVFNTGLIERNAKSMIYVLLRLRAPALDIYSAFKNPARPISIHGLLPNDPMWRVELSISADTMSNRRWMEQRGLAHLPVDSAPERVTFYTFSPTEMFFDPTIPISPVFDHEHLFGDPGDERRNRLPPEVREASVFELTARLRGSLRSMEMFVAGAPRVVLPQFFWDKGSSQEGGAITFLFPISMSGNQLIADCCLVLKRSLGDNYDSPGFFLSSSQSGISEEYRITTLVSLKMAYSGARAVMPVDSTWLAYGYWASVYAPDMNVPAAYLIPTEADPEVISLVHNVTKLLGRRAKTYSKSNSAVSECSDAISDGSFEVRRQNSRISEQSEPNRYVSTQKDVFEKNLICFDYF